MTSITNIWGDMEDYILPEYKQDPVLIAHATEDAVRLDLTQQARRNYGALVVTLDARYAANLHALEKTLLERKRVREPDGAAVTIIDPDTLLVGLQFGLQPHEAIQTIMQSRNIPVQSVEPVEHRNADKYMRPHHNRYSATSISGHNLPYIMSTAEYNIVNMIDPYGYQMHKKYVDKHEGYHYLDNEFLPPPGASNYTPDSRKLIADADYRLTALKTQWCEGFADIAAVGDLVREGHGFGVIEAVTDRRAQSVDIGHYTYLMLQHFQDVVTKIGIKAFRRMSDDQAIELYKNSVRMAGMTNDEIVLAAYHDLALHGTYADGIKLTAAIQSGEYTPNEIIDSQVYAYKLHSGHQAEQRKTNAVTAHHRDNTLHIAGQIELIDQTFANGHALTPETLACTYVDMVNALRTEKNDDAIDTIIRLKEAYAQSHNIPYIAENQARGIDVFKENIASIRVPPFDTSYLKTLQNRR